MPIEIPESVPGCTIFMKPNVYYGGRVTSWKTLSRLGTRNSLGTAQPGVYKFESEGEEVIKVLEGGDISVMLEGGTEYKEYSPGQDFTIPPKTKFKLKVTKVAFWLCIYCE